MSKEAPRLRTPQIRDLCINELLSVLTVRRLAEFPSAVEAVRAAVQFQTRIQEFTVGDAEDRRIAFRVGINIGDVIVEPHDIIAISCPGPLRTTMPSDRVTT